MRAISILALAAGLAITRPARADDRDDVDATGDLTGGITIGHISDHTRTDNFGRTATTYGAWTYGMTGRASRLVQPSPYSWGLGLFGDVDLFIASPGIALRAGESTVDNPPPQSPFGALVYLYVGTAAGMSFPIVHAPKLSLEIDTAGVLNTDFYGVSAELASRIGLGKHSALVIAYRMRAGHGWANTEVVDERTRVGFGQRYRGFIGVEYTHGYSEDAMSRADLGNIFKGGYTMFAVVLAYGGMWR